MRTPSLAQFFLSPATLASCAVCLCLQLTPHANAFPAGSVTVDADAPFKTAYGHALTSSDGLMTLEGWVDADATVSGNLWQWWAILGVDDPALENPPENGALLDVQEAITIQYDAGVGASQITFRHAGGIGGATNNLARIQISGFLSDPGAYPIVAGQPRISNLSYANGTLSMDYLWDTGWDWGQLMFANPSASGGRRLKITGSVSPNGDASNYGLALWRMTVEESACRPTVQPVNVKHGLSNSYTTRDGLVTVRGYSDAAATVPASLGTYMEQCFGVFGGNSGAIDGDETITLQFASGFGLSRIDSVYSQGQVTISGFLSDPGFRDLANGSFGVQYADGALSFYPMDGGFHRYFFTNRAASAGQTLKIKADPNSPYYFAIAGLDYGDVRNIIAGDLPLNAASTFATADGSITLNAFSDTPGTTPANIYVNEDWFGVAGGANTEAIDGTESVNLQFASGVGLSSLATRYTSGQVVISGFASDPGFTDPSGLATGISYSAGTLSFTFDSYRSPEYMWYFSNASASAGQTLTLRSPSGQIALTRIQAGTPSVPVNLSITRIGSDVVLTWPNGTLQQSTNVASFYGDVVGATSPYTNAISGGQRFFRVKVP